MLRRFRTKVKEQGFRTTVKDYPASKVIGAVALVIIGMVVGMLWSLVLVAPQTSDPATEQTIRALQHKIEVLEARVPADHFHENHALTKEKGGGRAQAGAAPHASSKIKRSKIKRSDGRVELTPLNTGCYTVRDRAECCKKIDSRYTIHISQGKFFGGTPCIPSAVGTTFATGNVCEPGTGAATTDQHVGSCDPKQAGKPFETLAAVLKKQKATASVRRAKREKATSSPDLNLMWVTDCQIPLEWSSVLLLWSALNVKQPGDFTRIATGCESPRERKYVINAMNTVADIFGARDRVTVHFAPKHITDERDLTNGEVYTPYTKAFGVKHFLDNDKPNSRVGVILDPDFVFNRPLKYEIGQIKSEKEIILPDYTRQAGDWKHGVEPGRPVAQLYGLGVGWLEYDRKTICGEGSPCTRVTESDAWK